MQLFHIKNDEDLKSIQQDEDCLIICNQEHFNQVHDQFKVINHEEHGTLKDIDSIHFESHLDYDAISFSFFEWEENTFLFEKVYIYISRNFVILVCENKDHILENVVNKIDLNREIQQNGMDVLTYVYYKILDYLVSIMFFSLEQFEEYIVNQEAILIKTDTNFEFEKIVVIKTLSFEVKRYLRLFGYIGDQIVSNDNNLILDKNLKYFKNISAKGNRLYEFGSSLHEKAEHLMDIYNTAVSERSNVSLNKLTVLSIFATPITVLSGIYGMNFVNMPELENEIGYFILLGVMLSISITIYVLLKRKRML